MVQRDGLWTPKTVENVKAETLTREVVKNVKKSDTLYTNEWLGNNGLKRIYDYSVVKRNRPNTLMVGFTQIPSRDFGHC